MKKLTYLIVLALILGLVLTGSSQGLVQLDSVNIGDTASEAGHNLDGWTKIWSGCGWCGPDSDMRLIWGDGGETCAPENNWASVTLDAGALYAKTLRVEHLDGAADDGFYVYIDGKQVDVYTDQYLSNTWTATVFDISSYNFSGLLTIKFEATAPAWGGCGTYGQVAFNMIELWGPVSATVDIDPDELNLDAGGKWITAYIELPSGYDVNDIAISSVELLYDGSSEYAQIKPIKVDDHDEDGVPDLMVKFDRADVANWFTPDDTKTLTLTGTVGGICFEGSDNITAITED